jgi:hypothetical protein
VRELFVLTSVAAILMTVGVLARESVSFRGLYSIWTLLSLLMIVSVWVSFRLRIVQPPTLAYASLGLYVLSMCLPVMYMPPGNNELTFGWDIAWGSIINLRDNVGLMFEGRGRWSCIAASLFVGGLANVMFVAGYLALLTSVRMRSGVVIARWLGLITFVGAIAARLLADYGLGGKGYPIVLYPGYGVWAASFLALGLGARQKALKESC